MKKFTPVLIAGILMFGAAACENVAKTNSNAPSNSNNAGEVPSAQEVRDAQKDANSQTRDAQRQSDERARSDRNQVGGNQPASDGDLESVIRNRLETEVPGAPLAVDAEEGAVTIAGNVQTQEQLSKVESVAKQTPGVKSVKLNVKIAPATPATK